MTGVGADYMSSGRAATAMIEIARRRARRSPEPRPALAPMIPIGLNPTTSGVSSAWWRETAHEAEAAGFKGVWSWDHFVSRGRKTDPVLECWTTLTAAAAATARLKSAASSTTS
jgi:alkanesulfonate monooxygenase SsuD/methylene tetrahydromethanopterin reductase-like flavin-dependent oxidoreductase (luciferase family)